jgi:hypothetical protein
VVGGTVGELTMWPGGANEVRYMGIGVSGYQDGSVWGVVCWLAGRNRNLANGLVG